MGYTAETTRDGRVKLSWQTPDYMPGEFAGYLINSLNISATDYTTSPLQFDTTYTFPLRASTLPFWPRTQPLLGKFAAPIRVKRVENGKRKSCCIVDADPARTPPNTHDFGGGCCYWLGIGPRAQHFKKCAWLLRLIGHKAPLATRDSSEAARALNRHCHPHTGNGGH